MEINGNPLKPSTSPLQSVRPSAVTCRTDNLGNDGILGHSELARLDFSLRWVMVVGSGWRFDRRAVFCFRAVWCVPLARWELAPVPPPVRAWLSDRISGGSASRQELFEASRLFHEQFQMKPWQSWSRCVRKCR